MWVKNGEEIVKFCSVFLFLAHMGHGVCPGLHSKHLLKADNFGVNGVFFQTGGVVVGDVRTCGLCVTMKNPSQLEKSHNMIDTP